MNDQSTEPGELPDPTRPDDPIRDPRANPGTEPRGERDVIDDRNTDRRRPTEPTDDQNRNPRSDGERNDNARQDRTRFESSADLGLTLSASADGELTVSEVAEQQMAAKIGITAGDRIESIDGQRIQSQDDFNRILSAAQFDQPLELIVRRDGRPRTLFLDPAEFAATSGVGVGADLGLSLLLDSDDRLVVRDLDRASPFAIAGIRRNDVIVSLNGRRIASEDAFWRWAGELPPGERLAIAVLRDGRMRTVYADLEQFQDESWAGNDRAALGVTLDDRYQQGALVQRVYRDSPADQIGIRAGDQIVRIDGRRVTSPQHLVQIIGQRRPGEPVEIEFTRRQNHAADVRLASREVFNDGSMPLLQQRESPGEAPQEERYGELPDGERAPFDGGRYERRSERRLDDRGLFRDRDRD